MSWELDDEHRDFQSTCRSFVDREVRPLVEQAESAGTFPAELWKSLGAAGLLGLVTPEDQGGGGGEGGEAEVDDDEHRRPVPGGEAPGLGQSIKPRRGLRSQAALCDVQLGGPSSLPGLRVGRGGRAGRAVHHRRPMLQPNLSIGDPPVGWIVGY
jgi:hypothetical protein